MVLGVVEVLAARLLLDASGHEGFLLNGLLAPAAMSDVVSSSICCLRSCLAKDLLRSISGRGGARRANVPRCGSAGQRPGTKQVEGLGLARAT